MTAKREPKALTKRAVDDAQPTDKQWILWDGGTSAIPGFGLRVSPGGAKTYLVQYRMRGTHVDRRYTIGRHGEFTPAQARDRAMAIKQMVRSGIDPRDHHAALAEAAANDQRTSKERSFGKVADSWLDSYKTDRKGKPRRASSLRIAGTVVRHFKSQFGEKRIDKIGRGDVRAAIDAIDAEKVAMRSSAFSYGRILWKWAYEGELVEDIPFAALSAPAKPESRERVLAEAELPIIWRASRKVAYPFGPAFRLMLITGQRRSEVLGMTWAELDKEACTWTIPGDRTKNKLPHVVPLSDLAMIEVGAMAGKPGAPPPDKWPKSGLVFTTNNKTAASGVSKAKARLDSEAATMGKAEGVVVEPWRLHDLRRTMATALESEGINPSTIEAVLNHIAAKRGKALGAYARYDYGPEKRAALDMWAGKVSALVAPKAIESAAG